MGRRDTEEGQLPAPVKPPDGGWGWIVLFGCFVITGFSYAFPKAVSVYFKELMKDFHVGYSDTAWISSIMLAMLYGTGDAWTHFPLPSLCFPCPAMGPDHVPKGSPHACWPGHEPTCRTQLSHHFSSRSDAFHPLFPLPWEISGFTPPASQLTWGLLPLLKMLPLFFPGNGGAEGRAKQRYLPWPDPREMYI